jgi:hypothetical protein
VDPAADLRPDPCTGRPAGHRVAEGDRAVHHRPSAVGGRRLAAGPPAPHADRGRPAASRWALAPGTGHRVPPARTGRPRVAARPRRAPGGTAVTASCPGNPRARRLPPGPAGPHPAAAQLEAAGRGRLRHRRPGLGPRQTRRLLARRAPRGGGVADLPRGLP